MNPKKTPKVPLTIVNGSECTLPYTVKERVSICIAVCVCVWPHSSQWIEHTGYSWSRYSDILQGIFYCHDDRTNSDRRHCRYQSRTRYNLLRDVCARERERKREGGREGGRHTVTNILIDSHSLTPKPSPWKSSWQSTL